MKKQDYPQKKEFFDLLHKAIHKGDKANRGTKKRKKSGGYSGKRTHQHKTASA